MSERVTVTFIGAGSTIFLKNIVGDMMLLEGLKEASIRLYDIDRERLKESSLVIEGLNQTINANRARIETYYDTPMRKDALKGADFVVNTIQVGGYDPATIADFEIPKQFGLKQTIGDTLGIGGIFRGLRTIPVMLDIIREMEEVCPGAILLNYTNPMSIVTGAIQKASAIQSVGLCHSVQVCVPHLLESLGMSASEPRWKIYGINHMAWLLELYDGKEDIYQEVRKRALKKNAAERHDDMVRFEIMRLFGYYTTESSEHLSEYTPYFIRKDSPDLIERFNIPLDEYPRRCRNQISQWEERRDLLLQGGSIEHELSHEYGSRIMQAVHTDTPYRFHGNILNTNGLISNLPAEAVVEVPCLADRNGIQGVVSGALPQQCAALNMTNINVHLLTIEAARRRSKEALYQAALLDPHTSSELPPDRIIALCDSLLEAHEQFLGIYS